MSCVCPRCHRYPLEDHIWWSMERSSATGGVRHVATASLKDPNRILVTPHGVCDNLITANSWHTHTRPSVHDEYLPCDVPLQSGGSTHIPSVTGYELKLIETEAIELEDLDPRKIELGWNLGTGSVSNTGNIYEKVSYRRYGGISKSFCKHVLLPVSDAFRLRLSGEYCRLSEDG